MAAALDHTESMDEDFTGFDEEPMVVTPSGPLVTGLTDEPHETDSDSGALVIAESEKKPEPKPEKSPRKRRSRVVEDVTPTRAPSSRVRGQGLAYLIAMEKGGSKKQLAKAQAQVDAQEAQQAAPPAADAPFPESDLFPDPESQKSEPPKQEVAKKTRETPRAAKEKQETLRTKEKDAVKAPGSPAPDSPASLVPRAKGLQRKSQSGFNISSPLLKEPFNEGWRREVVYRAVVDPGGKTLCDVYYYAPDGKKLRSGREVGDYLEKTDSTLTVENFTFFKEPIGMDINQEILRYAKTRKDDVGNEKLITKKEKALKAREDELRKSLQELGEDVAAITAQSHQEPSSPAESQEESPQQKKKRGPQKAEKQLKIKLWGKGLRSKENAEPKEDAEIEEEAQQEAVERKPSPVRKVPDDISHLFTPRDTRSTRSKSAAQTAGSNQQLELINGKRFISVGPSEAKSPAQVEEQATKRALPSPGPKQSPKRAKVSSPPPVARKRETTYATFASDQFTNFVSYAYHGLLHVFRYLTVQELMAAAGVCRLWRDMAMHHSHWRLVRLKNSRVYNWPSFTSHLRRAGTQYLDMRKMLFVASPEETWQSLESSAANLSELSHIDLCKCPSRVLDSIAKNCRRLKVIDAQFISSPTLDVSNMGGLRQLEELKVRSISGCDLEGSLEAFSHLHHLKSLSLTTINNMKSSELKHLADLPLLETLEVGDCMEWTTSEDYRNLARLSHLRHLRLEHGPQTDVLQHLEASLGCLSNLQQLELVNFTIDAPISSLQLSGLRRFLIIPNYSLESLPATMRHLYECLTSMTHLQQLCWVVTEDIISSLADGKLPLQVDDAANVSVVELEELLRKKLPNTLVHLNRLPEYAARRYSLSMKQED